MGIIETLQNGYDIDLKELEPMRKHTTVGVGGVADYYVEIKSLCSLKYTIEVAKRYKIPYKIIGNGSNLLVSDKGYRGIIISTKGLNDVFFKKNYVRAMCGASLRRLATFVSNATLTGMECLEQIPATVGGAITQNAGAFMSNISDNLVWVETLCNGKIKRYEKKECKFGYRTSIFKTRKDVIISATFDFSLGEREKILEKTKEISQLRKKNFPLKRNFGSVFKNPDGEYAGRLIELAGLKGYFIGGAEVSSRHANFIECSPNATAENVYNLICYVKTKVNDMFGVKLKEEVEYIGEF